jgi:hypothetical protein
VSQKQEYKPPKTSDESVFEMALSSPKIISSPVETLKESLRQVFFLIGLRAEQIPTDEEKGFLIQYIVENYGGHTGDEIKLAFKMAIQGKLKIDSKDVRCYGIFSPMYFTTIMDSYRVWASEQAEKLSRNIPEKPITEIEKRKIDLAYAGYLRGLYPSTVLDFITMNK